ncbi:IclR family transcriptional regulator [Haloarcula sp. CBA1130]|uniref:IclR family transcriptional regulator n=1 Tax=unclassified Haloarcula TaxID=2624677 RepID=UPI0012460782|nr:MULTISPECIES: IclR family transcriptional regulator [unclassified Haloarcula]KAA9396596.1 IclR family transcriptional regulator [Haloarcula sp. CBA1130]KAA9397435.1 IclR family transcriptional regulator [Haloarcula sp. CBA1129]
MTDEPQYAVESTQTSVAILEALVDATEPVGVTDLADIVGVSKSVAHNHLATLRAAGYVVKRAEKYEASLRPLALGERTRESLSFHQAAKQQLENLAAATGETATLFVLEEAAGVPVSISEPDDGWSVPFHAGERLPLHVNATGKALLSSLPSDRVESILNETELVAPTDATIVNPDELTEELRRIRDDGIAFCRGEHYKGIIGVAAPLPDVNGNRVAALGVCGPVDRLNGRYLREDITGQVLSTTKSIQVNLTAN